jgi:hypothetical protein
MENVLIDGGLAAGYMDADATQIVVASGLPSPVKAVTLMHEILHALLLQAGSKHGNNENLIECLAYGLVQLSRDNKGLFDELSSMTERLGSRQIGFVCPDEEKAELSVG